MPMHSVGEFKIPLQYCYSITMKLLLASKSPRRRELLALLDVDYQIIELRKVDEIFPEDLSSQDVAPYLSSLKADAYADLPKSDEIVLTADTVVICDGTILGKPADEKTAIEMLTMLSGKTHRVVTGVTLMSQTKKVTFSETTLVSFDTLTDDVIRHYVEKYRPFDKAGAYGIQEWIGCVGINEIKGCYYNVMGLPLHSLYKHLKKEF